MTTSGVVTYNETTTNIVTDALLICGAIEEGEAPSAVAMQGGVRQLNRMVKSWQKKTVLWTRREAYLYLSKGQSRYQIGPSAGSAHTAEIGDAVRTELSADAAAGAGSISVDSTTGIAVNDNIGVVLDDGTIDWFTVSAIPGAVTLSGTLTSAASTDNQVFAYTSKIDRPLSVIGAQLTDENDYDTPIIVFSHEEYQQTPNKTGTGRPSQVYYQAEIPDGYMYVWQAPSSSIWRVRMTCKFPVEDFVTTANNPDFPQEALDALTWNLAQRLMTSYGTPESSKQDIRTTAAGLFLDFMMHDQEDTPIFFQPEMLE